MIAAEKPDLIFFSGDLLNDYAGLKIVKRMFAQLASIAPVYVVDGNWDDSLPERADLYEESGGHYLHNVVHNVAVEDTVDGIPIRVVGTAADHSSAMELAAARPNNRFTIFLHHCPGLITQVIASGVTDLYLAGNTHGGQVALPLYGSVFPLTPDDRKYLSGLYRIGAAYLYLNRGLGTERRVPFRFLAPPEITVIEVTGSTQISSHFR